MEKIRNLSLKKTIIFYTSVSLLCSFFLAAAVERIAAETQEQIWWKYVDQEKYLEAMKGEGEDYEVAIPRASLSDMSPMDGHISELCDFLDTYAVLFISIGGSSLGVGLFYKNKLKKPIDELRGASQMIAEDELDFHINYKNRDELGQLCGEFERMRMQLEENNRTVWRMMEDEKALRAAIAHDIRSPLCILKGYQEMLLEFVPEGTLEKEKILEMLQDGMNQIERLNRFIETMRTMTRLEERKLQLSAVNIVNLGNEIGKEAQIIAKGEGKTCILSMQAQEAVVYADTEIILEVAENLLSNACRYARKGVKIIVSLTGPTLDLTVLDDGEGFTEGADTVTQAFYHSNPRDDLQHFGMGMYISKIYCERHGGRLWIGNQENGGGAVKAVFQISR